MDEGVDKWWQIKGRKKGWRRILGLMNITGEGGK